MPDELNAPQLGSSSFVCPHCHAKAHQTWFRVHAERLNRDDKPYILDSETYNKVQAASRNNPEAQEKMRKWADRVWAYKPIIEGELSGVQARLITNLHISLCFSCDDVALWSAYTLIYPVTVFEVLPNSDMPESAKADFLEAASIVNLSPRGAAALLRLSIQKIMIELKQPGKNINDDIAALVQLGLPVAIQRALDVVRVNGNNAVHPGEIDLRDDKATAIKLFALVNMIVDTMITTQLQLDKMFQGLPPGVLEAIEKRDRPKT